MKLTNIRLYGFKSFAERTEINVNGDLVAVVGPNGCGKSNIVDAILWALGEPNPRHIRAGTSTDVIFSGSANRKPLGYAEVVLTFDNENGVLPLPTSEVTVGRRIDRKGESLYTINGQPCRLKDIHELLADTGLGRFGYAIVSQSDIDAALSAEPEERRVWIDEAAGVQRYRARKQEALKRLDSALQHLRRVEDVLVELEPQCEPLRKQAEVAKIYKEKLATLRELESGILVLEAARYEEQIAEREREISQRRTSADSMRKEAEELEKRSEILEKELEEIETSLESLQSALNESITKVEKAETRKILIEQKIASLEELSSDSSYETEQIRLERAKNELEASRRDVVNAEQSVALLLQVIRNSSAEAEEIKQKLDEAEARLQEARKREIERIESATMREAARKKHEHLQEELRKTEEKIRNVSQNLEDSQAKYEKDILRLKEFQSEYDSIENELSALKEKLLELDSAIRGKTTEKHSLESRAAALKAAIEGNECFPLGARAILEAVEQGALPNDFIPLGSIIEVPSRFAQAIEAALGYSSGDLITSNTETALRGIAFLREKELGRATFLPRDRMQSPPGSIDVPRENTLGIASELVSCAPEYKKIIESYLGSTVIVENIEIGREISKRNGKLKIATLHGEVLVNGVICGGKRKGYTAEPITQTTKLKELETSISNLDSELETLRKRFDVLQNEEKTRLQKTNELRAKRSEMEKLLAEDIRNVVSAREELATAERIKSQLLQEFESYRQERSSVESNDSDLSDVEELEKERNELLALHASKSADAEQARRALEDARERQASARERLRHAEEEYEDALKIIEHRKQRHSNLEIEREKLTNALKEAIQEFELQAKEKEKISEQLQTYRTKRIALQNEIHHNYNEAKQMRETARSLETTAYQDDVQRARLETKLAGVLTKLLEEYGITEEEARKQAPLVNIPKEAQKIVAELRRELRALGDVNLGAIEAYEQLSQRYETLRTQREDILKSKEELDKSIFELDRITRGAFLDAFNKVNESFSKMFRRLFGGGNATLKLTNPDRLLDTGIELEVEVPGKKMQRLELLSGGERALAACAFLFALFDVKPSPVCILDELDAPMDGRNVERYVELLLEFSQRSQYIVITHNPTTIEASPIWFGVTMQEPGVSTIIPYVAKPAEFAATQQTSPTSAPQRTQPSLVPGN
ncbi:MAG TPA: chromosome segregation protein SMC [Fimbriimonadales bacterium]|nr:chromosome segregation protein SMC [Fimbriimonadales bacterium]